MHAYFTLRNPENLTFTEEIKSFQCVLMCGVTAESPRDCIDPSAFMTDT